MFRSSVLLVALCLAMVLSGCGGQAAGSSTRLVPVSCNSQSAFGLLFVTIENRGNDAGPSTMTLVYKTTSRLMPQVQVQVKTPGIAAGTDIWVAVELPSAPGAGGLIKPAGKITITVDAMHVLPETNRADQTLVTSC